MPERLPRERFSPLAGICRLRVAGLRRLLTTAWLVKHKILEAMRLAEADRQLTGRVEIDDAYLGGERSGGKTGRGSENKVPFVAAVQTTEDGRPHLVCPSPRRFTNEAVEDFLATHMALPLTLVSDGLGCFTVAKGLGAWCERPGGQSAVSGLLRFIANQVEQ